MDNNRLELLIMGLREMGLKLDIQKDLKFYDEPHSYNYVTQLHNEPRLKLKYGKGAVVDREGGSGLSFTGPKEAFTKSLFESIERICLKITKRESSFIETYRQDSDRFINLGLFTRSKDITGKKLRWFRGKNLTTEKDCLIPMQTLFLDIDLQKGEPEFNIPQVSTGAAAGINHTQVLLNCIYEVVERDALMCVYLNKITPQRIDLHSIRDEKIDKLVKEFKKYKLELFVLDVTTDLGIPVYISVLVDRTGAGPAVSIGSKSSFRVSYGIISAIEESFMSHLASRILFNNGNIFFDENLKYKDEISNRVANWYSPDSIRNIEFLISGKLKNYKIEPFNDTIENELHKVVNLIAIKKFNILYSDITLDELKKLGVLVYKVLIPGLQPLYLHDKERLKMTNVQRLSEAARYFKTEYMGLNTIPHPFL